MKKFLCILSVSLLLVVTALSAVACSSKTEDPSETLARWQRTYTAGDFGIRSLKNPFVEFTLDTNETIRLELYPTVAPITVNNFVTYVEEGFYEGTAFHRIVEGEMIQGGGFVLDKDDRFVHKDATHNAIKGEFESNGVTNNLLHTRGVLSTARTEDTNGATSQFFICAGTVSRWDGDYAAFGKVIDEESMEVVSRINKLATGTESIIYGESEISSSNVPVTRVKIKKAQLVWDK